MIKNPPDNDEVTQRLLSAACDLFLDHDYAKVTTRQIAQRANVNSAMIKYYFKSKLGLFDEVIRLQHEIFNNAISQAVNSDYSVNYQKLFRHCFEIFKTQPKLAPFLVRILVYKDGPGYHTLKGYMDEGQALAHAMIKDSQAKGLINPALDPDVLRVVSMSLSTYPLLIQSLLIDQLEGKDFDAFLDNLAIFSANIYQQGLAPSK
mgnify:FL=1